MSEDNSKEESLPGSHLAVEKEPEADTILRVLARFAIKSMAWFGIYFLGYFNFSIGYLITPLVMAVLRDQWKKEKRDKLSHARIAALTNEKSMIESRIKVEDLPSWVFFPDKDRAEWLNNIVQQLWPNVGHYTRRLLSETIEPAVRTALEGYKLTGFKFDKVVLGQVPPRITGVKVYDRNTNRNEIIMDMDIILASDCDIGFVLKGFKARISDFSLRGVLRVVFKPLITDIPLIGGIQVFFLTPPEIDFDLGGIANALDAPGLSNIIRSIILEQVSYFMVLPNKYTMSLAASVDNKALRCPDTAGVLRVLLHRADKLMKKDIGIMGMGKSDPLTILTVGNKKIESPMIKNSVSPEWNFTADFPIEVVDGQELLLEVWDHDDPGDNEFLGRATVQTSVVADKGIMSNIWVDLEDVESGKVQLTLTWMETTTDPSFLNKHDDHSVSSIVQVYIDSCKGLESARSQKPCPMIELSVGSAVQTTIPQFHNCDPVYEQGFVFLVVNPEADDLKIKIINMEKSAKKEVLGFLTIRLSDLLRRKGLMYENMPFTLKGTRSHSVINMATQIRVLKTPHPRKKRSVQEPKEELNEPMVPTEEAVQPLQSEKVPQPKKDKVTDYSEFSPPELFEDDETIEEPLQESNAFKPRDSRPSIDQMISGTLSAVTSGASDQYTSDGLRHRKPEPHCGQVKVSLKYNAQKEELKVTLHEASGLPGSHLPDPPDPYVKMYLLPERKSKSKRKSDVVKDSTNPVYNEIFEYDIPLKKLSSTSLEISVVDKKGIFARSSLMGRAVIDFINSDIETGFTDWYPLFEVDDDSD